MLLVSDDPVLGKVFIQHDIVYHVRKDTVMMLDTAHTRELKLKFDRSKPCDVHLIRQIFEINPSIKEVFYRATPQTQLSAVHTYHDPEYDYMNDFKELIHRHEKEKTTQHIEGQVT